MLTELQARSIRVPEDVSVAGFDDVQSAAFVSVPLTTVRVPMHDMGAEGAALLLDIVAGRQPRSRVLPVELVTRRSTAPPLRPALAGEAPRAGSPPPPADGTG